MPQRFFSSTGNMFTYQANEALHPILEAVIQGNLEQFIQAVANLEDVEVNHENIPVAHPGDLHLTEQDEEFGYAVSRNLAWLAAHRQQYHLLQYMLENHENLGLRLEHFISVVYMANHPNSPNQLRDFVETNPEIIEIHDQEMGHIRPFQAFGIRQ